MIAARLRRNACLVERAAVFPRAGRLRMGIKRSNAGSGRIAPTFIKHDDRRFVPTPGPEQRFAGWPNPTCLNQLRATVGIGFGGNKEQVPAPSYYAIGRSAA